jgi:acyl-CoA synthetase (AMP-forming)/AMP-acid ligase II
MSLAADRAALRERCYSAEWSGETDLAAATDFAAQALGLTDLPDLSTIITLDDEPPAGTVGWADLLSPAPLMTLPDRDPDQICLLIYASGTTSEPKGVQHTHNSVLAASRRSLGVRRVLAAFPYSALRPFYRAAGSGPAISAASTPTDT